MHLNARIRHGCYPGAKTLLIMKLTAILLLAACLEVSASGRAQQVTLSETNTPLKKVFAAMHRQTGYLFFYDLKDLKNSRPVTITVNNAGLEAALDLCFKDQPLTYTIVNRTVVVKKKIEEAKASVPAPVAAPPIEITGTVTNGKDEPLAGVTVYVKGTRKGGTTDEHGNFKIIVTASNDLALEFSIVGYESQTVKVGSQTSLRVVLKEAIADLSSIVIVGYGTQKRENLTGAVATVGAKELENRPLVNVAQGLQGLIPNLNIDLGTGRPGASATFNIRGVTSINSGSGNNGGPLIMVDGVQMDPNLINPGDIESVTVLKDAASAAIYGSRGAYGVMLITTRNGKKNSPTHLNYTGSYAITRPTRLPKHLNSVDYINMHREADRNGQLSGGNTASFPFTEEDSIMAAKYFADPKNNPTGYPDPGNSSKYRYVGNTDWVKVLYPGWAPQQQHNLSVAGGSDKTSYIGSLGYFNQKGMLKLGHEDYQRINPSIRVSTEATPWLSLNLKTTLNHIRNDRSNAPTNSNSNSYIQGDGRPNMPVYNPGGNDYSGQGNWTNPVAVLAQNGRDILTANDLWLTGGAVLTPVKHVRVNADYTFNSYSGFEQQVQKQFSEYGVDHVFVDYYPWTYPDATTEISNNNNYTALNLYANYENTFNKVHYFKATVGYNQEYRHYKMINTQAKNLIDPGTPFIGLNSDPKPLVKGNEFEWALNGLLYRLNYIFSDKYLLEVDGRYDGTSAFPNGKRYVWSPSASAGWRISEEHFFASAKDVVNDLKLRVSYGKLPNQKFDPANPTDGTVYPYVGLMSYGQSNYIFGSQQNTAVGAPGLVSPGFTWETVTTRDAGLDLTVLNQRLTGSFDWYARETKNMLVSGQPLPGVLGTAPPSKNAASLMTKGWELNLTWSDKIGKDLSYSVRVGLSDYTAKITKYDLNPTGSLGDYYVGKKFNEIWGLVTDGYFKTDAEAAAYDQSQLSGVTQMAGDIKYADLDKNGKISYGDNTVSNPGDQRVIGNSTPRYQYGLNLKVQYKRFDLAVFVQGVGKRDYMPGDNAFWGFQSEWSVPFVYMKDHWTQQNPNAYFPRLRFGGGSNFQTQTKYLQSAAYARLKNLSIAYTLPAEMLSRAKIKSIRVYVTGQNLFEITKMFKAYDPETIGFGTYPLSRSVSFGLQLGL
ncbi:TonB-dependent receptor [Flavitalea sp. BT771]|uniref:TonB-dependent receptor n=1 Tax=Flavitalea sp. BT771 TaxID=3063329 RepID=UPI0026E160FC|nr:TonB-dependent receptor [Flavitalea sp. BT771]MDO6435177.1 TonB-dependent receptor [Flavitalea sp. BT771]MDV6224118.1 TonB-dependent receptor [Flavitalea sp. BT771]